MISCTGITARASYIIWNSKVEILQYHNYSDYQNRIAIGPVPLFRVVAGLLSEVTAS